MGGASIVPRSNQRVKSKFVGHWETNVRQNRMNNIMRKFVLLLFATLLTAVAWGSEDYIGLYMSGTRVGYSCSKESDEAIGGKTLKRTDSLTVFDAGLLGQAMSMRMESVTWRDGQAPIKMHFKITSSGRSQVTEAKFEPTKILLHIDNNGAKSERTLARPTTGMVVDDAVTALIQEGMINGRNRTFHVLDPMTGTLVENKVTVKGPTMVKVKGQDVSAILVEISDPRAPSKLYLSNKGDFIKGEGPMGMEMLPITKEEALSTTNTGPRIDLANATAIKPVGEMGDTKTLRSLRLNIAGKDLSRLPNDGHQEVIQRAEGWDVTIHPIRRDASSTTTIKKAQYGREGWIKPSLNIPSDSKTFRSLSAKVIGSEQRVSAAADKIRAWVYDNMSPNAGIGVLRDASEVLKTKEGVCRDYATLTATMLRAVDIPARICAGLVYVENAFYYHAWVEFWDGANWIGLDSTLSDGRLTVGHIKLSQGNVEEAFVFTLLESVKIEVVKNR